MADVPRRAAARSPSPRSAARLAVSALLSASLAATAAAAPPDAPWRTVETERFRLHYPLDAEPWALQAASRLEAIRDRVADEVGSDLGPKVDIVVRDPFATANGMALPLIRRPRMELWVSPPDSASSIGWNRRWDEGLIVHEDTHLVHLARRSRGGLDAALQDIVGLGPVAIKSPRWVAEGYATVVEGDLTGFGRPFSAQLAAELRKLATEGRLPEYGDLDGSDRWRGGGYAYGVGSAFLRWLREREGEDSLRQLWARMSAVQTRSFDDAFEGLFGDSPQRLYGRFRAELTAAAMAHERALPPERETRFLDFEGRASALAVSPSGEKLAVIAGDGRRRLAVYPTTWDPEEIEKKRQEAVDDLLEADPQDIPDRVGPEAPVEREHQRSRRAPSPAHPRWLDDTSILFTGLLPDSQGRLRADLFVWTPAEGTERRVTRRADVSRADPAPDGTWAVAIRQVWGATGLVRVDLQTGAVATIEEPSVDVVFDQPRISPDGSQIAYLAMRDGPWELFVRPVDGPARQIATPPGANLATPAWHPDGDRLLVTVGTADWLDIVAIPLDGGEALRLTRSPGGAFGPDATSDHLYFLGEATDGRDVHRVALEGRGEPLPEPQPASLATAPAPPDVPPLPTVDVAPRPYGLGQTEGRGLISGAYSRGDHRLEIGARYGDMVGRHELLILIGGSFTPAADPKWGDGARAALAIRALPIDVHADLFAHRAIVGQGLVGGAVALSDSHRFDAGRLDVSGGGGVGFGLDGPSRHLGFSDARLVLQERAFRLARLELRGAAAGGSVGGDLGGWARGGFDLDFLNGMIGVGAGYGAVIGQASPLVLGGVRDATLPDAWQLDRVIRPAFPTLSGTHHLVTRAHIGGAGGLMIERHLLGDARDLRTSATVVGFEATTVIDRMPSFKIPSVELQSGFGCLLEDPVEGIRRRPCTRIDDYTAWGAITWRR